MGAEAKAVEYQTPKNTSFPTISSPVKTGDKHFKIYLATPALFKDGHCPESWFKQNGLRLLTAAIGRAKHIGGFDYKLNWPKPMLKAVPAGTVYYIEVTDAKKAKDVISKLHEGNIYELAPETEAYKTEFKKQGFGLTYLGNFNIQ